MNIPEITQLITSHIYEIDTLDEHFKKSTEEYKAQRLLLTDDVKMLKMHLTQAMGIKHHKLFGMD
jgi:hypothetical protein